MSTSMSNLSGPCNLLNPGKRPRFKGFEFGDIAQVSRPAFIAFLIFAAFVAVFSTITDIFMTAYVTSLKKLHQYCDDCNACDHHTTKADCKTQFKFSKFCVKFIFGNHTTFKGFSQSTSNTNRLFFGKPRAFQLLGQFQRIKDYSGHTPYIGTASLKGNLCFANFSFPNSMIKPAFHTALIGALIFITCFCQAATAATIDPKTRGMLDYIGSIEGPAGYDDYYRGVSSGPPRPLTTMTVQEVLNWQDSIDAKSKSEAAGRYQIMEDTLRGMVKSGAADPNARFDANTQDQLAAKLLKRRGWDPKRTDYVTMGNAIAYEWAALPRCSGLRKGRSAYDGIIGNSARTTCEAYLEVLKNGDDPAAVAWALEQSVVGTSGTGGTARVNNAFDRFIKTNKNPRRKRTGYSLCQNLK